MSQQNIFLADMPKPDVVEQVGYEEIFQDLVSQFNGYQPLLFDTKLRAVVKQAELVTTPNGDQYFRVPVGEDAGLYYLELDSDPTVKQLQILAYREMMLRQRVNDSCHAVMPAYAKGADLDNLGARYNIMRLTIQAATTSTEAVMESDPAFLRRINLAYDGYTTAGSVESYIFHGLSASGKVKDIGVFTPAPTENIITVLSHEANGIASPELLVTVEDYLSSSSRRPNSELVTYRSAEIIEYEIKAQITFNNGPAVEPLIEKARQRCQAWCNANFMLGRDVTESAIHSQLHLQEVTIGMHEVVIETKLPIRVANYQAARCIGITLNYAGRDV